jgi:cyclophilin family peptidyl-prolyl cis-trans isomerase
MAIDHFTRSVTVTNLTRWRSEPVILLSFRAEKGCVMKYTFLSIFAAGALLAIDSSAGTSTAVASDKNDDPVVVVETSLGKFKIELNEKKAPLTVKNFLKYVDDKFYDGTIFHRVIPNFMVQGGGFEPGLKQKRAKDPIKNEASNGLTNDRGTIAMARTSDPDSATAQFFVNVVNNKFLNQSDDNPGYAVFGKVTEGMDVVDKIVKVATESRNGQQNVPVDDVVIKSIRREKR